MCNPKPGSRCATDARKPVTSKVSNVNAMAKALEDAKTEALKDHVEGTPFDVSGYREHLSEAADEYNYTMANYYSTSAAQKDKSKAIKEGRELTSSLTPEAKESVASEHVLYQAGRMAAVFHKAADNLRRSEMMDQLSVARKMNFGGFEAIHKNNLKKIENEKDAKLGAALAGTDGPTHETEEIERQYRSNVQAANIAYRAALKDAGDVITRDRKANSAVYRYDIDPRQVKLVKTARGDFHITTRMKLDANNIDELEDKVYQSFNLEDVQITPGERDDKGVYEVDVKYIYRGSEDIADALQFHDKAWKGSPRWQNTLAEIERVSNNPISYDR